MKTPDQTLLDRAIGYLSPERALRRELARSKAHFFRYEAARSTRLRPQSGAQLDPESSTYQRDRFTLMNQARELVENYPLFAGIQEKLATYIVGSIRRQADTGRPELDRQIEEYLDDCFADADITGRHTLTTLAQLAIQAEKCDGDCGFIIVSDGSDHPKLQGIEADRIGNPNINLVTDDKFGGIIVDPSTGRPLSYEIYNRSKGTTAYTFDREVAAEHFLHVFEPNRLSQYRGVTAYASVIQTAKDLKEIMEGIRIRTKYAATIAALVTTENGSPNPEDFWKDNADTFPDGTPKALEDTDFGQLKYLSPGESVAEFKNEFPSAAVQTALDRCVREISTALNLPYGLIWDMSGMRGPGARFEAAQAERTFERERDNLIRRMLNPYVRRCIIHGVMAGRIEADALNPRTFKGYWQFPKKLTIDVGREGKLDLELYRAGLLSAQEYFSENGQDWKEQQEQIFEERAHQSLLADIYGIDAIDQRNLAPSGQMPTKVEVDESGVAGQINEFDANVNLTPPKSAQANAKKVLRWRDEHPDEIEGMTQTGWTRARQIASGEALTPETVKRMASFNRHRQNSKIASEKRGKPWTDAGYVAWLGWGGDTGIDWSIRKSDELDRA